MRDKGYFILGIFLIGIAVSLLGMLLMAYNPDTSTFAYYAGYNTIDFLIGFGILCFGIKWVLKPFDIEKKTEEGEYA